MKKARRWTKKGSRQMNQHHAVRDVDAELLVGTCSVCGPAAPVRFRRDRRVWLCKANQAAKRQSRAAREQKRALFRKYGLTEQQHAALFSGQRHVCAICGGVNDGDGWPSLFVDHDHESGLVRGLLCHRCNVAIGLFRDSKDLLRKAEAYLSSPPANVWLA